MNPTLLPRASRPRGVALVGAVVLAVAVAGLAFGLLAESEAGHRTVVRSEGSFRALELAETGMCRVESVLMKGLLRELARRQDPTLADPPLWQTVNDGTNPPYLLLTLARTAYGDGTYEVTATCPVTDPNDERYARRWTVRSHGNIDHAGIAADRWIECGYWMRPNTAYVDGLLSIESLSVTGTVTTDSYDSTLGTYASQVDPTTGIADFGGSLGSNTGDITGNGTILVNGDGVPGPDGQDVLIGGATIVGETEPRTVSRDFPPPSLADFQNAYNTFAVPGRWSRSSSSWVVNGVPRITAGSGVAVNSPSGQYVDFRFTGTGTVTFSGGTYFFNNFTAGAGTILRFTGPSKIYVTESFGAGGATFVNATPDQVPSNVQIYAHPYPIPLAPRLPGNTTEWTPEVKIAGGPNSAWVMYGPEAELTVTGNGEIFGAAVAKYINLGGTSEYHYDRALDWQLSLGAPQLERRYWKETDKAGGPMDVRR